MEVTQSQKKKILLFKICLSVFIFWFLIHNSQLKFGLFGTLYDYPIRTCIIVLLCYLMVIFHAWRWYRLNVVQNIDLSFLKTILPTYLGIAFNTVLPGSVGGDFVRLYYVLNKFPTQKSQAVIAILVDRIVGLLGIFIIACLMTPFYLKIIKPDSALYYILIGCIGIFAAAMLFVVFSWFLLSLLHKFKWMTKFVSILEAIRVYRNSKKVVLETLMVSAATQVLLLIVVLMLNNMMDLPSISIFDFMLALVVAQVANLVPLTPGGVGIGEAAFANVLLILNPEVNAAYATIFFALRLISTAAYLPGVFIGIYGFHFFDKFKSRKEVAESVI